MPSLSAVIAHWYPERQRNLTTVVDALRTSTRSPEEILIWDNTGTLESQWFPHAAILRSPWNVGCKAKFLGALMCHGDYVFMTDNDIIVRPGTLAHMMDAAQPDRILTLEGHYLHADHSYAHSEERRYDTVTTLSPVHTLNCRTDLIHRETLKRLLADIPFDDSPIAMHEDLWLAASAEKHHIAKLVVPGSDGQGFALISEQGVGMSIRKPGPQDNPLYWSNPQHYEDRERYCHQIFDPVL